MHATTLMADTTIEHENAAGMVAGRAQASISRPTDPYARFLALSVAAVFAACLILNAASLPTRLCRQSDQDFGSPAVDPVSSATRVVPTPEDGPHVEPSPPSGTCMTNPGRREPAYR